MRVRFFAGMVAVSGMFIVGSSMILARLTDRMAMSEVTHSLQVGLTAYERFEALEMDLAVSRAWSIAETPYLKAVLSIPELDHRTALEAVSGLDGLAPGRLVLLDAEGAVLADAAGEEPAGSDFSRFGGLDEVFSGGGYAGFGSIAGRPQRVAAAPVVSGSVLLGAVLLLEDVGHETADRLKEFTGHDVMIAADEELVAWSGSLDSAVAALVEEDWKRFREQHRAITPGGVLSFDLGGKIWRTAAPAMDESPIQVFLARPLDDFHADLAAVRPWIARAGLAGVLLAVAVGLWLATVLARPLVQLRDAAREVGRGAFDHRVAVSSRDEVGELAEAFNGMAEQLRRHTEDLRLAKERAEELSRVKSEFLANMSHEIRTPLNGVLATASVLKESPLDERQARQVARILQSGDLLLAIIDDILDIAKIEAKMLTLEEALFSLRERIIEVVELQRPLANAKGLLLELDIHSDCPEEVFGDPVRFYQILSNLVGNAVKFTQQGRVSVRCEREARVEEVDWLRLVVEDTGIGVRADRQARIFDKFTQADGSTTREYGGTGLGLTICAQLAILMGGDIGLESEEGVGSTFWLRLPLRTPPVPTMIPLSGDDGLRSALASVPEGACVLLVEDNQINQEVISEMLTLLGYDFELAINGLEAVRMVDEQRHAVVLMDCEMPKMGGLEATEEIRRIESGRIPIIALTAHASRVSREACLSAGMDGYLSKPVRLEALAEALEKWVAAVET